MLTNALLSMLVVFALVELVQRVRLMRVAKENDQLQKDAAKVMRAAAAEIPPELRVVKPEPWSRRD